MKNDTWIKQQVSENNMIAPFVDHTVRKDGNRKILSYGLSPSGYDLRLADKIVGRSDNLKVVQNRHDTQVKMTF